MSQWRLYRVAECHDVRWASLLEPSLEDGQFLPEVLDSDALLRAELALQRLGCDEAEVFRADGSDGKPLDLVVTTTADESFILLGRARRHSSGLLKLAFVYSALARSRDAVVFTDASGAVLGASARWRDLYGYRPAEVLGRNPRLVNSRQHSKLFFRDLWRELTSRDGGSWSGELVNRKRSGDLVSVWQTITTFRDATDSVAGYLGVTRDMTAHRELVARLTRSFEERDRAGRRLERRVDWAADALRTPLGELGRRLRLISELAPGESTALVAEVQHAISSAEEVTSLIDRELDLVGARSEAVEIDPSRVYLRSIVRTEVELQSILASRKGVTISLREYGPSLPCFMDEVRMSHVVGTVINRVVMNSKPGDLVNVLYRLDPKDGSQEVVVDGIDAGSSSEDQVMSSNRAPTSGEAASESPEDGKLHDAGRVVRSHGGSMRVRSVAVGGCRIAITVPHDCGPFLDRPWAVVVFDPGEQLWPVAAPLLRAEGVPGFVAHEAEELRYICEHELPNVVVHASLHPIPDACRLYRTPSGDGILEPAICTAGRVDNRPELEIESWSGPEALVAQVVTLLTRQGSDASRPEWQPVEESDRVHRTRTASSRFESGCNLP